MKILNLFNNACRCSDTIKSPYIIAEVGVNHEADMNLAKRLIDEAKEGGADAVKFQTYKANTIASKDSPAYWDTTKEPIKSQFKLFQKYDKFWKNEYEQLKIYCDQTGIEFLSTPFDIESANFLNDLMDVFKISSSDITNKPFIEHICNFKKPIILSTGASYLYEIQEAVGWIDVNNVPVALLHCVLNYPTSDENANLGMIKNLQKNFPDRLVGYSDHTLPNDMKILEIATLLGAIILEKHFTHDKTLVGNDHYHSMDKEDLKLYCSNIEYIFSTLGSQHKYSLEVEKVARINARRSLIAFQSIQKGTIITEKHLTWKRPAHGISPRHINSVLGREAIVDIAEDELLQWNMLSIIEPC
jgi:sialic acid synthase SpsE